MIRYLLLFGLMSWSSVAASQGLGGERSATLSRESAYLARKDSLIHFYSAHPRAGYFQAAARLYRGDDLAWVEAALDTLSQRPSGDMFWMYPSVLIHFLGQDQLSPELLERLRDLWRTYTPYRGDTENHWAMYYASLYLMAQHYPDLPGDQWYNGKSSIENFREARDYLLSWMELTTTSGQGEFDSPHYMAYYVAAMAELYAFATDPAMAQRAGMMIDYLMADFAAESLNGMYVGGFSRIYPDELVHRWDTNSASFAWLLFDTAAYRPAGPALILAMSGYRLPEEIYHIARDRSRPYVHRELKRTRHRIRYSSERNVPVYRYTYMSDAYAVSSIQGGLLQPIQQHTWEILWSTDRPEAGYNMLFTLHPYSSGFELAMYFPEEPEMLTEAVVESKGTYDSPDKWTGASPFERVAQVEDALVVLYDIPAGTRFPFISGFFPKTLVRREVDASGWIFCQGGPAYIAYYPLAAYEWREEEQVWRLHSSALKNGAVVQAAEAADYPSFEAFKRAVRQLQLETQTEPTPRVRFTSLDGSTIDFTYGEIPEIDSSRIDRESWPLFDGPFLHAEPGSRKLTITYGSAERVLDFEGIAAKDSADPRPLK